MNGIHDLGGMDGFGPVPIDPLPYHHEWEKRIFAMMVQVLRHRFYPIDTFRHAVERLAPVDYLGSSYFERWRKAVEKLLLERNIVFRAELQERYEAIKDGSQYAPVSTVDLSSVPKPEFHPGFVETGASPKFAVGETVRARNIHPRGHTRLPRYVRGKVGTIRRVFEPMAFPDTRAHDQGENPQPLYSVGFDAHELWGRDAEPASSVWLDLFESYLEPETTNGGVI